MSACAIQPYVVSHAKRCLFSVPQVETAVDKVQELMDNPHVLKSVAFMLVDMLVMELFPELTGKLAGMDAVAL